MIYLMKLKSHLNVQFVTYNSVLKTNSFAFMWYIAVMNWFNMYFHSTFQRITVTTNCAVCVLLSLTGSICFSKCTYLPKDNCAHKLYIVLIHCLNMFLQSIYGHKLCLLQYLVLLNQYTFQSTFERMIQHSFSKHFLENTCDHKLCSFMVDGCHELIQYVFSKNLLDNNCDHKLCIIWYIVLMNTV